MGGLDVCKAGLKHTFFLYEELVKLGYVDELYLIRRIYSWKEGVFMLALQGYYDGNTVQTLEKIQAKKSKIDYYDIR